MPKSEYVAPAERTDLYCPACGAQSVIRALGDGDYYEGPVHACTSCKRQFTMPSEPSYGGGVALSVDEPE